MRPRDWLIIVVSLATLALAAWTGISVVWRLQLWKAITRLEADLRVFGPIVEEARSDPAALTYSEVCEVGRTKVPRMQFVQVKYQDSMCLLRTDDWSAVTGHEAPIENSKEVMIAVRVEASRRESLGWWDAMRTPDAELGRRLALAFYEYGTSRITRVVRTPTRTIGVATPIRNQGRRHVLIETDGETRLLVWQFVPGRQPLDEEFLIDWALRIQY